MYIRSASSRSTVLWAFHTIQPSSVENDFLQKNISFSFQRRIFGNSETSGRLCLCSSSKASALRRRPTVWQCRLVMQYAIVLSVCPSLSTFCSRFQAYQAAKWTFNKPTTTCTTSTYCNYTVSQRTSNLACYKGKQSKNTLLCHLT